MNASLELEMPSGAALDSLDDRPVPTGDYPHLDPRVAGLVGAPLSERLAAVNEEIFVPHRFANDLLGAMRWRMELPAGTRRTSIALGGGSGLGKTHIMREFMRDCGVNPKTGLNAAGERTIFYMDCTSVHSEWIFRSRFGRLCGMRMKRDDDLYGPCELISKSKIRFLIFDEAHTLRKMKRLAEFPVVSDHLKLISNICERPMMIVGDLQVEDIVESDGALSTRFKSWKVHPWTDTNALREFVDAVLSTYPLPEPSPVTDDGTLGMVIEETRGNTEAIVLSLRRSAYRATERGAKRISRADWLSTLRAPY